MYDAVVLIPEDVNEPVVRGGTTGGSTENSTIWEKPTFKFFHASWLQKGFL